MGRKTYRRKIVTPETLENINPRNSKLAEQFLKQKKLTASATTITSYKSDLDIFFSYLYLKAENVSFIELKKYDIIEFFSFAREELLWGSARTNRLRSTLSSLSQFVERVLDEKYPQFKNIVLHAVESTPKDAGREKTVLSDEDVNKILSHFKKENVQIACWFALAIYSGMRFSELLRVNVSTIADAKDAFDGIFLYTSPIKSKGRGGNRADSKYILKKNFLPYFNDWVDERKKIIESKGEDNDSLFIRKNGVPATTGTVNSWVKQISDVLGKTFYAHSARHRMTTSLSLKGIPRSLIQALLGWKSADLVEIYDDSTINDRAWDELENLK